MRLATPFTMAIALLAACALALSACGGEDAQLLPGETAREIDANLTAVQRLAREGDCVGAESAVEEVGEQIEGLEGVDPRLKRALEQGATRLNEVIDQCEEEVETTLPETTEPEEAEEGEEREDAEGRERAQREGREGGRRGNEGGGGPEPRPEGSEGGEERSQGREGGEGGGGERPSPGGGEEPEEEPQSGGVGPGAEAGGAE